MVQLEEFVKADIVHMLGFAIPYANQGCVSVFVAGHWGDKEEVHVQE